MDNKNMISLLSHEIKTPIASINGYSDLIRQGMCDGDSIKVYSDKIYKETIRMNKLVDQMSLMIQLEKNYYETCIEEVDVLETVTDVVKGIVQKYEACDIDVDISGNAKMMIDKGLLKKAINEIVENAVNYGYNSETTSYATIHIAINEDCENVRICIEDEGRGIDEKYIDNVREVFFRVDKRNSRKIGGNGLGLSVVNDIVLFFNGNLDIFNIASDNDTKDGGLRVILTLKK